MPRKEKTNAKTWERERRNRMNAYFKNLAELLPPNQEGKTRNKVDILIQASKYIKELNNRIEELFHAHAVDAHKDELNRLKKLVTQFYSRTQLLSTLLKEAGITVPAEPALEKISPLKWSNKINVEDADKYLDRFKERLSEKRRNKSTGISKIQAKKKLPVAASPKKSSSNKEITEAIEVPVEDRENHLNSKENAAETTETPTTNSDTRNNSVAVSSSDTTPPEVAGPKPSTGIRKFESRKKAKRKIKQLKTKKVNPTPPQSQSITNLPPGTLILSGGKIMPLVTPIASNILVNTASQSGNSIILSNTQSNPMIVMQPMVNRIQNTVSMGNPSVVTTVQKLSLNTVPNIRANVKLNSNDWVSNVKTIIQATKIGGRKGILPKGEAITQTTMAYKVPIPAIHRDSRPTKTSDSANSGEKSAPKTSTKRPAKRKKSTEKGVEKSSAEEARKKRKNPSPEVESPPTKTLKIFPDTCASIENLRHVVEKIGDDTKDSPPTNSSDTKTSDEKIEDSSVFKATEKIISPPSEDKMPEDAAQVIESEVAAAEEPLNPCKISTKESSAVETTLSLADEAVEKLDSLLEEPSTSEIDSTKIILNLDTHTTTTMKPELPPASLAVREVESPSKVEKIKAKSPENTFVPIGNRAEALHSDLSNDLFASLQVPSSAHNPESISPTAAFLMAFPLVTSLNGKTEVLEEDMKEDLKYHSQTPPMLLQIGTIEPNNFKVKSVSNPDPNVASNPQEKIAPKVPECQSEAKEPPEAVAKNLPKILTSETFKERVYKIIPYSEPKKIPELDNTMLLAESHDKKISQKPESMACQSKFPDITPSVSMNDLTGVKYASLPDYVPSYPNFSNLNDNQMLPDNSRVSYAPQGCPQQNFPHRPKENSHLIGNQQNYQANSLPQYNYPPRSEDRARFEQTKNDLLCTMSPHISQTTYAIHGKESNAQMPYQDCSISKSNTAVLDSTPTQLTRAYIPPLAPPTLPARPDAALLSNLNDKDSRVNSYQGYSTQATSKPSIDSFDNLQRSREQKKVINIPANQSNSQITKQRYPQPINQQSNYCPSSGSDNLSKSTTTIAHNTSTFSILSWTTFSPITGGVNTNINNNNNENNGLQFETNESRGKSICENFNYTPVHKENTSYGNNLSAETFNQDTIAVGVDKTKSQKLTSEKLTQKVVDGPKSTRNPSEDFKFPGDNNKNKSKFPMDSTYTQTEFHGQHTASGKIHEIPVAKVEKSYVGVSNYESQVSFDIGETASTGKCSSDVYPGNYKYGIDKTNHTGQVKYQGVVQHQQQNVNVKAKQQVQQTVRPPVNWMMTPEIKHNTNISDLILPPIGKELEFCQNNLFSQAPTYNQNTPNQFYNNYDTTVSTTHSFPNVPTLQNDRRITESYYNEEQQFSWSPTKNPEQMKTIDQQIVPSTLPTLVGDLALGTNMPEKQNFLFSQVPARSVDVAKAPVKEKEITRDFQAMLNTQPPQSASFLSVSQLVEHEKEKSHQQDHHPHHHHHHPQQQQQQQQQQPQRKHPRKGNTNPRAPKRQMELRKNEQQVHQHVVDEQKVAPAFSNQTYQQNDLAWRNRNCKSNYTAEALIGVNNSSVSDGNTVDKQLHGATIKFSSDYSQNKFSSAIPSSDMVMPPINYLSNPEETNSYGQMMNQNFNHSSYTYSPNTNIYPSANFITGISNTPSSYMMPLHDNPTDYLETNAFLLPNVNNSTAKSSIISTSTTTRTTSSGLNVKNNQHYGNIKHQGCADKRNSYSGSKKSKKKIDTMHNLDFPLAPIDDYHPPATHHHASTFLPPPPPPGNSLYQNHSVGLANSNRRTSSTVNSVAMAHHPSGTSLTNFNLSTIFPEINDKVAGYKPGLTQSNSAVSYPQRVSYTNNNISHVPQVSEAGQFASDLAAPPSVLQYKAT